MHTMTMAAVEIAERIGPDQHRPHTIVQLWHAAQSTNKVHAVPAMFIFLQTLQINTSCRNHVQHYMDAKAHGDED